MIATRYILGALIFGYLIAAYNDAADRAEQNEQRYLSCLNGGPVEYSKTEVLVCKGAETMPRIQMINPVRGT